MKSGLLLLEENGSSFCALAAHGEDVGVESAWTIEYYNRNRLRRLAALAMSTRPLVDGVGETANQMCSTILASGASTGGRIARCSSASRPHRYIGSNIASAIFAIVIEQVSPARVTTSWTNR
jgi:hypothetical protein